MSLLHNIPSFMPRSTKRKRPPRVQTEVPDEEEVEVVSEPGSDGEPELDIEEPERQEENGDTNHRFEVEAEIWDLFREEFHEGALLVVSSIVPR
jgi:hypothetical protein